jgi:uncharacterized damage-inducible protein DinB
MISKPQANEHSAYAARYVNSVPEGADVMELLEANQTYTYNLFSNMDEQQAMYAYAPGKWTLKQLLGHMIDTERVFTFRAFVFSREDVSLPGFDQEVYVNNTDFNGRSIQSLSAEFRTVRESTLYLFGSFSGDQLLRQGTASGDPVTVRALVHITAGHEIYHLNLIKEQYLA